jgi:hypothetical protein
MAGKQVSDAVLRQLQAHVSYKISVANKRLDADNDGTASDVLK